jgi:hypothetical protein
LRSHHGSYIDRGVLAVHGVTFPTVHNVTVLRLVVVNHSADASYSVSWTHNVMRALWLFVRIVLENASLSLSLCSVSGNEG